jgi:hypothetical protein
MYRRFYRNDELISNVLVSFALLLLFGILISWKLVGVDTFDAEMIVYIVLGSLSLILFICCIVIFLIGGGKRIVDIEIDLKKREIRTFNGHFVHSFDEIKLYSFNTRHRQVRLFLKHQLIGFFIDEVICNNEAISIAELERMSEDAVIVAPKELYNYHLLINLVVIGFTVLYLILANTADLLVFNRYIPTYYALLLCAVLCTGFTFLNHWRMNKKAFPDNNEITEQENTINPDSE